MAGDAIPLGSFEYGDYVIATIQFTRNGVDLDPGSGPHLKATLLGTGTQIDLTPQLVPQGNGAFTIVLPTNTPGEWEARAWSTGAGQTSRNILWTIGGTANP